MASTEPGGDMAYQPIENYAIVGNMHTAALVGVDGSIDWLCYPVFDSPSVFGAILDDEKGGRFRIAPIDGDVTCKQLYLPESNVLQTRFFSADGVGQVTDFMPVGRQPQDAAYRTLMRRVTVARGSMAFRIECRPAFNYARTPHTV